MASARAGNVIGGGDWAEDRLIPDFVRSIMRGEKLHIRSPKAIRPWQHVLEPLSGYLALCEKLCSNGDEFADAWNFGSDDKDVKDVEWITKTICKYWKDGASYCIEENVNFHESNYLKLDCSKAKALLGWHPRWDINTTLHSIVDWNKSYLNKEDMRSISLGQITKYFTDK